MATLSVIIITKDEAHRIKPCLESVLFADEIIIFDSGSQDGTPDLCRSISPKVKVTVTDWPGYGAQKQRALETASGDWVLCIDADECVSPALQVEIRQAIEKTTHNAFDIVFKTRFCGKLLKFGDGWNDSQPALFRRGCGKFSDQLVHEGITITGSVGRLRGIVEHDSFPTLEWVIEKMNLYSTLGAKQKVRDGKKGSFWQAISHGIWAFIRGYILRGGFLDGKEGFIFALSNAEYTYYRYLKNMYLQA